MSDPPLPSVALLLLLIVLSFFYFTGPTKSPHIKLHVLPKKAPYAAAFPRSLHPFRNLRASEDPQPLVPEQTPPAVAVHFAGEPTHPFDPHLRLPVTTVQVAPGIPLLAMPLFFDDQGPFYFVVSTGHTTNVISPQLQAQLGVMTRSFPLPNGAVMEAAFLRGVRLAGHVLITFFSAAVQELPSDSWRTNDGDPIVGLVGMELLEQCDLELSRVTTMGELKVYGSRAGWQRAAQEAEWQPVQCYPLPQRLMGVQVRVAGEASAFFALIDTGRAQSVLNDEAASLLGLKEDAEVTVQLSICSLVNAPMEATEDKEWRFVLPSAETSCVPFDKAVTMRHSPSAAAFLREVTPLPDLGLAAYAAPMMILGQDVLSQRDMWISGNAKELMFRVAAPAANAA